MADYDIAAAFAAIENELISSMHRNLSHHRAQETDEGIQWAMWQAEQLKVLEQYKKRNRIKYKKNFEKINNSIDGVILNSRKIGGLEQETQILKAIKNGFKVYKELGQTGTVAKFIQLNDKKLDALINATKSDFSRAEAAMLRMSNDQYRKIIFNAQVYANAGGTAYAKAVDMATKDFLASGINCIAYKNGARHTVSDYADMAIRTASKRAYLTGEGEKRREWGICTVIVNKRGNPCPRCLPFCGRVFIDDLWSGGTPSDGDFPLLSSAIAQGLYHPRCKDSHTTYFEGISTTLEGVTLEEREKVKEQYEIQQKSAQAQNQANKCSRIAENSLDKDNKRMYSARAEKWQGVAEKLSDSVAKSADGGIINSGATAGALSPYSKAAEKHAVKYYEFVRHMTTDTQKISEATKISQDKIDKIKKHVFIDEHDLLEGRKRFTPSYDMAESWQRLIKGDYQEKDMILLKHEYYELRSMEKGLTQNEAHIKASKRYNYSKYCE